LGAFAKLRKTSYLCHVCLSVGAEQLASHWTDFNENQDLRIFKKSAKNLNFIKIRQEQPVLDMKTYVHWCQCLAQIFLE